MEEDEGEEAGGTIHHAAMRLEDLFYTLVHKKTTEGFESGEEHSEDKHLLKAGRQAGRNCLLPTPPAANGVCGRCFLSLPHSLFSTSLSCHNHFWQQESQLLSLPYNSLVSAHIQTSLGE